MNPLMMTRPGHVPTEQYGQAHIQWLAGRIASGAEELMFGLTTIAVGGSSPMHRHPNCEEVLHILDGEIEQVIKGGQSLRMTTGDTVTIPRNVKHRAINVGGRPAKMIVVFSSAARETVIEDGETSDGSH